MSLPIITAIRQRRDLKESLLHTAQELAHRASIYGIVQFTSYSYLAEKSHCSTRTAIRHIQRLEEAKIIRKTVRRIAGKGKLCEINHYAFLISWDKRVVKGGSDKTSRNLPNPGREKETSVREELENQRKAIRLGFVTPGSAVWEAAQEKIVYLEGLLAGGGGESE